VKESIYKWCRRRWLRGIALATLFVAVAFALAVLLLMKP
jgi:hypothetical protein